MTESPCLCQAQDDGTVTVCDRHVMASQSLEYRVRQVLDAELDAVCARPRGAFADAH